MKTIALILLLSSVCFAAEPRPAFEGDVVKCVEDGEYEHVVYNEPVGEIRGRLRAIHDADGNPVPCSHNDGSLCSLTRKKGALCVVVDDYPGPWASRADKPCTGNPAVIGENTVAVGTVTLEWEDMYCDTIETHVAPSRVADQEPWHPSGTTDGDVLMHNGAGVLEWTTCPVEYINRKPTTENKKESKMLELIFDSMKIAGPTVMITVFLIIGIPAVLNCAIRYVKEDNRPMFWENKKFFDDYGTYLGFYHVGVPFFAGVVCFIWPLSAPVGFVCLALYLLRGAFRFDKKIKKALDFKSDKGHVHPEVPE